MNDQSPRTYLGLDAASEGDLHGLLTFVSFVDREMMSLGLVAFHPDVAGRVSSLRADARDLANYLRGFVDAGGGKRP